MSATRVAGWEGLLRVRDIATLRDLMQEILVQSKTSISCPDMPSV